MNLQVPPFPPKLDFIFEAPNFGFSVNVGDESVLARVLFILRPADPMAKLPDPIAVERELAEAARTWSDKLKAALVERHGEADGLGLARRMADLYAQLTSS